MILIFTNTYIISILIASILFHKRIRLKKVQSVIFYSLFVVSLAIIAYHMEPPSNWDLSRNFMLLNTIRNSHLSFNEFVFGGRATYIADGYRELLFYNIYRYIIVHIFNDNHWFQTTTVIIVYAIFGYILIDFQYSRNEYNVSFVLSIILSFTFLPFVYVTSGIRNGLAASIIALGIYLYLYKNKNIFIYFLFLFISATIHPAVLITVPFVFLSKVRTGIREIAVVAVMTFLFQYFARLLSTVGNRYLRTIGIYYLRYSGSEKYRGGRGNLYGILILSIIFLGYFIIDNVKHKKISGDFQSYSNETNKIKGFLLYMLVYMIFNFQNYDLVLRPGYIIGMFSPFFAMVMQIDENKSQQFIKTLTNIAIVGFSIYVNYKCLEIFVEAF